MENYYDPELCGYRTPSPTDWTPEGSPTLDGVFSDDEEKVVEKKCSFCIEERAWTESTRQLRETKQEVCLQAADEQVALRARFEEKFKEKFEMMKYWSDKTQRAIQEVFCLREQMSRLRMGIYGRCLPPGGGG
ncbi:hypothetical protein OSTOST_05544 [Ostertagia ostertagi]